MRLVERRHIDVNVLLAAIPDKISIVMVKPAQPTHPASAASQPSSASSDSQPAQQAQLSQPVVVASSIGIPLNSLGDCAARQ